MKSNLVNKHKSKKADEDRFMNYLVYGVTIFGGLITIPQIVEILVKKDSTGVSLISWGGYILTSTIWLLYGLRHKEKPIIYNNIMWVTLSVLVLIAAIIYK